MTKVEGEVQSALRERQVVCRVVSKLGLRHPRVNGSHSSFAAKEANAIKTALQHVYHCSHQVWRLIEDNPTWVIELVAVLSDGPSTDKSPHISKHVSFAYAAGDRRSSHGTRGVHDATNDDEGGDTDGNSDSEATEDWEDGTTLFSGIMETDSL